MLGIHTSPQKFIVNVQKMRRWRLLSRHEVASLDAMGRWDCIFELRSIGEKSKLHSQCSGNPINLQTSGLGRKTLSSSMRNEHPHIFDKGTRRPGPEEI